ncbi:hypothetical protein ABOM_000854 [Aspergillus bombycis]|uniref:Uncharacterized protein n=1 Tax=Aspergillus bombycis TaxID=109264 RepID=A0A1F8AF71_9EURO|nr:hypothetical protein ABOM_000854 [Aspergillus bombycis]OGM50374.1 hypothetical protein ABOM_000854 [Aspergillus bombycis]
MNHGVRGWSGSWPEEHRDDWSVECTYQLLTSSPVNYVHATKCWRGNSWNMHRRYRAVFIPADWSNRSPMRVEEILRKKKDPMKAMRVEGEGMMTGFKGKIYDPPQCGLDSRIRNA